MTGLLLTGFVLAGAVLTMYQGYRGFMFQWLGTDKDRWTTPQRVLLFCIADSILYVACTASGFLALFFAVQLSTQIRSPFDVSLGTSLLLVFLAVYGILGVTAQLPHLIQQGKLLPPGAKGA